MSRYHFHNNADTCKAIDYNAKVKADKLDFHRVLLRVDQIMHNNFLCTSSDVVHKAHP